MRQVRRGGRWCFLYVLGHTALPDGDSAAINVPEPTHTDGLDCKSTLNPDAEPRSPDHSPGALNSIGGVRMTKPDQPTVR